MKKYAVVILTFLMALLVSTTAYAYDLPIDITAIGRQDMPTGRVTHRIGANLFTEDARQVNNIFAARIQLRQETSLTLFKTIPINYEADPHTRVMTTAYNLALFSQPTNFTMFDTSADSANIPTWLIIIIFAICAVAGFALALKSIAKKRRQAESVY